MIIRSAAFCLFTTAIFSIAAAYFFYPLIVKLLSYKKHIKKAQKKSVINSQLITVSVIIPFVSELHSVVEKIKSLNSLEFSDMRIDFIIVNDGCPAIKGNEIYSALKLFSNDYKIKIVKLSKNYGKTFAQYIGALNSGSDFLLFTDCNSIFSESYFSGLKQIIQSGAELAGGFLKYRKNGATEENYWKFETNLKTNEQRAGFFNTGMFGSNIVISKKLYLDYPYYVFCDFSLPLYHQNKAGKREILKEELYVTETIDDDTATEVFHSKKRIVHRALFGMLKSGILSGGFQLLLAVQLYFHKITRWLSLLWIMIVCAYIILYADKKIVYIFFIISALILSITILKKNLRYAAVVTAAAFAGILCFCISPALHKWKPSKK